MKPGRRFLEGPVMRPREQSGLVGLEVFEGVKLCRGHVASSPGHRTVFSRGSVEPGRDALSSGFSGFYDFFMRVGTAARRGESR